MKRTIAVASALLCLAAAAGPAWADGEDDPTFGNVGTTFIALGEGEFPLGDGDTSAAIEPRTDQAADGAVITATALGADDPEDSEDSRGGFDRELVRVTRVNASGVPGGLDGDGMVDLETDRVNDLLDVEALADGRIVVVVDSDSFGGSRSSSRLLQIRTLTAAGVEEDERLEVDVPDFCDDNAAEPAAADVAADGRVFAAWNCKDGVIVARYTGDQETSEELELNRARELEFVGGSVYVLASEFGLCCDGRLAFLEASVVGKLSSDLVFDGAYGEDGFGASLPGAPLDLTVGPGGEVTVWTDAGTSGEGPPVRGDEPETWHFYNLDMAGERDDTFDEDGHAAIQHPELGPTSVCRRRGGCQEVISQLAAQSDGKVVAVGSPPAEGKPTRGAEEEEEELPREFRDRTIIRLTTAGALDSAWDGDGVRQFELGQPGEGFASYIVVGPPVFQTDGKLLLPSQSFAGDVNRVPTPPDGFALGISRIGLTPATTSPPAGGQPAAAQVAPVVAASRSCVSRRVFRIRLRTGRSRTERSAIRTAKVTVNGSNVPVTAAQRRTSQVNLTGLPRGRFTVVIQLTLADGGKVRDVRRYRTCAPKQERELPGLRTRKPKRG